MGSDIIGKEALLGQLRDEGYKAVLVNRLEELMGVFNDNIPQFCTATRGQLGAAYAKAHPETVQKGLGERTYRAFDRLVAIYKQSKLDMRQVARAAAEEQERKEAEKARARLETYERVVDFDALTSAMAALGTLGLKSCAIGKLLEMHDMALKAKEGAT